MADHQAAGGTVTMHYRTGTGKGVFLSAVLSLTALVALAPPEAEAQRLDRLFSTHEERALLDELRRERHIVAPEPQSVADIAPEVPRVEHVTIDGVVLRSSGANSVWINGRQVVGGTRTREGVRVDTTASRGGRVKITLPSGAETVDLKPGQKIDVNSGMVVEAYERASGPRAFTVFDRVTPETSETLESDAGSAPPARVPAEKQKAPSGQGGIQYPEALLERIRRALGEN